MKTIEKFYLLIIGIIIIGGTLSIASEDVQAISDDCTSLHTLTANELEICKMQIESQIEERSLDFNEVASQTATYRELVAAGESEMIALNTGNNAARVKVRIINRLLSSFQQGE